MAMAMGRSISLAAYLALARRGPRIRTEFPGPRPEGELVWAHVTSQERMGALVRIAEQLKAMRPGLHVLVTLTPELARPGATPAAPGPAVDIAQVLPEDTIQASAAFLAHWRPDLCLWTGGHFRPALLHVMGERGVPAVLIDASEDGLNVAHQRWLPELARANLRGFAAILARNGTAAQMMRRLGIAGDDIAVTGPLQSGGNLPACNEQEREELARMLTGRPLWLAAQVRLDELDEVLRAHCEACRRAVRLMLILAPANAEEGPEFRDMLDSRELGTAQWSEGDMPDETTQVLLADTSGDLGLWYRLAPISFLGSSLRPGYGGCDPNAPAGLGSAILYGPHVGQYLAAYSRFADAGAARIVNDAASLSRALLQLLAPDQLALMARAAWEVESEGAEATDRVTGLAQELLDTGGPVRGSAP